MRVLKKISNLLLAVFLLFLVLAAYSEKWFLEMWDPRIGFSTVIYQLFIPLKGAGEGVVQSYLSHCVLPTMLIAGILAALWYGMVFCGKKLTLVWKVRVFGKAVCFRNKKAFAYMGIIAAVCMLCHYVWRQMLVMGITDYIRQITNASVIFDEEYVDPDEIELSFPEKKRNLLLIYLESMETTYASVEAGGGKKENYIPELTELAYENLFFSDDEDFGGISGEGADFTMGGVACKFYRRSL